MIPVIYLLDRFPSTGDFSEEILSVPSQEVRRVNWQEIAAVREALR